MKVPQTKYRVPLAGPAGIRKMPVTQAYQSMGRFGETLARIGFERAEKQKRAREISQFSSAKVNIINDFNEFRIELSKDTDYSTHRQKAEKRLKEIYDTRKNGVTEPNARDELKRWCDLRSVELLFEVDSNARQIEYEYNQVLLENDLRTAEKNLDKGLVGELLDDALAVGTIFPDDAERERTRIYHNIDFSLTQREAYSRGLEKGLEYINSAEVSESITADDREAIANALRADIERARKEEAEQLKKAQEELYNEGISEYIAGTLTMAKLNTPKYRALKNENRTTLVNMLKSRPKEEEGKPESEIDDPVVILDYMRLYDDPQKSKDELKGFLSDHLGVGISPGKYMEFYKDLEIRRPDLARKAGQQVFTDMRNDGTIDKSTEAELNMHYHEVLAEKDYSNEEKINIAEQLGELYKTEEVKRRLFSEETKQKPKEEERSSADWGRNIREGKLKGFERTYLSQIQSVYATQLEEYRKEKGNDPVSISYLETGEQVLYDGEDHWVFRDGRWYKWSEKKQDWIRRRLK